MPSVSPEHPKTTILFVGDPPKFENQLRDGHPFSGKVSVYFKDGIESAELPSMMFEKTFCCVSDDIEKLNTPKQQVTAAQTSLYPKLIETKPLVVVCCGASALKVVCGEKYKIKDWAGKHFAYEFEHDGKKITFLVFVSWSPGFLIHNDHLLEEYYGHFKKIKALAENYDKELEKQAESAELDYTICTEFDQCMREIKKFDVAGSQGKITAWDLETSGLNPHAKHSRIGVLSLSIKSHTASVFIWDHVESTWSKLEKKRWLKRLATFFRNKYKFIAHNGKFDGKWIKKKCGVFPRLYADTMLMSWILNENPGNHGLKQLAVKYTDLGNYEDELAQYIPDKSAFCAFLTPPIHVVARYAAMDADVCIRCYEAMLPQIQKKAQYRKLSELLLPKASQYLAAMEYNGAKVDLAYAQEYADELTAISDDLMSKIRKNPAVQKYVVDRQEEQDAEYQQYIDDKHHGHKAKVREWKRLKAEHDEENERRAQVGKRPLKFSRKKPNWETLVKRKAPDRFQFNLNSGDQLRAVFFDKLRYNPLMQTESGLNSTNKETLIHYKNEQGCKFSATLLDYRLYSKILSTYIAPMLLNTVGYDTGYYAYGNFNLTSTTSGRLSANNPNLQNIGSKGGGGVKRCYVTRFDGGCLVAVDYSQIELRLAACLSRDKTMLNLYKTGQDIHAKTMFGIYDMSEEDYKALDKIQQKEMRRVAKVINFGLLYSMGAGGVVAALRKDDPPIHITEEQSNEYVSKFHKTYKGLSKWLDRTKEAILETGYIDSPFGRRRRLPEVRSSDEAAVARAQRQGVNHPIQSGASDMTLVSGIIIWKEMKKRKMKSLPVITVHDSIIFDVYPGEAQAVIDLAKEVMTNLPKHGWKVMGKDFDWSFLICPIEIGIDVGYNWRDLIELGSEDHNKVKVETVEQALAESVYKRAEADKTTERDDYGDKAALADVRENLEDEKEVV